MKIYGELEAAIRTELVRRGLFEVDTLPQRLLVEAGDGPEAMSPGGPESTEAGPRDTVHLVLGVGTEARYSGRAILAQPCELRRPDVAEPFRLNLTHAQPPIDARRGARIRAPPTDSIFQFFTRAWHGWPWHPRSATSQSWSSRAFKVQEPKQS